jgi:NADPH2:quinone reductase
MKAIGATSADASSLAWFETESPTPGPKDLLVRVEAIAVNPVDTKVRKTLGTTQDSPRILGWDAAGTVVAVGAEVTGFQVDDEVFYAGDVTRPGANAELQVVDERIVAHKPTTVGFAESAAWPLVSLTAWELLFERMGVDPHGGDAGKQLLIINAAGGVGSVMIQLAKHAGLEVIATASRTETVNWCRELGADHVINHHEALAPQLQRLGFAEVPLIANLYEPSAYWQQMGEIIAPLGALGMIVEPESPVHIGDPYKAKCVRIAWEFMFARSKFALSDLTKQGEILEEIACRVEAGQLKPILTRTFAAITPDHLREAHAAMESGTAFGKWVLEGGY